jgi:MFS family permease
MSRWLLVGIGVVLWSLASGASGLAEGYMMLLLTRCFVGVGEAAYGPTAPGVISDLYPVKVRGSKLAWFYAAIPVGGALGYVLGGYMADTDLGWRWAFYLVVPPGILLGLLCFLMREPPRGQADAGAMARKVTLQDYTTLIKTPSYVLNTLGMAAMTFAIGGIAVWMPTYIYEREARWSLTADVLDGLGQSSQTFGALTPGVPPETLAKLQPLKGREFQPLLSRDQELDGKFVAELKRELTAQEWDKYGTRIVDAARTPKLSYINVLFGAIVVLSGFGSTLLGGWTGDVLRPRFPGSYFLVSGISMLIAFPVILLVVWLPFPIGWFFIFIAVFALFFNTGPTNTILANVTHPAIRASAFALNIFVIHVLGDVISPVIMGAIWDLPSMDRETARNAALAGVSVVVLVGGLLWLWGARYLERDTALAPTCLRSS